MKRKERRRSRLISRSLRQKSHIRVYLKQLLSGLHDGVTCRITANSL